MTNVGIKTILNDIDLITEKLSMTRLLVESHKSQEDIDLIKEILFKVIVDVSKVNRMLTSL